MIFTPDMNDGKHIFVFGSNESGHHAGGAAREAARHWGALESVGFGPMFDSFAIPTMDWDLQPLPLSSIQHYVARFLDYAGRHPEKKFLVSAIGTGICGYTNEQIAPMFAGTPDNCVLPEEWK